LSLCANAVAAKVSIKNAAAAVSAVLECFMFEEILPCLYCGRLLDAQAKRL
jgi:hypothetical protein